MDNLRDYGEDDPASSSGLGRSVAKLPSSFGGPHAPTSSQAPVMADSTPAIWLVTSGPVPAVSAPTPPTSSVPKDSALALDDLPPPPPPAEPYEVFLARVQREVSSLPVLSTQPGTAVPPRPAVATPTTGSRLPTPFPRFEDSSWALQSQTPNNRIRILLCASSIALGVARTGLIRWLNLGPWSSACYAAGRPSWTLWIYRPSHRTFCSGPFPCSTTYNACC